LTTNTWNPDEYQHNAGFVSVLGVPVLDELGDIQGKRILDLGCGDGVLSLEMVKRGAHVVGVDSSPEMIASAQAKGLEAFVMDAQALTFENEFDAVFTNATLHWVIDHDLMLMGVNKALKSGGSFVGEFGGHRNVSTIVTALLAVLDRHGYSMESRFRWNFRTAFTFSEQLAEHGLTGSVQYIERPTPLPTTVRGWLETFANPFFVDVPNDQKVVLLDEVVKLLSHTLLDEMGNWYADYVRLRFSAKKL
jgi:trans-aconitate methyltransferase